jgi:hypothetical protein
VSPAGVTVGLQASAFVSGLISAFRPIAIEKAATCDGCHAPPLRSQIATSNLPPPSR